MTEDLEQDKTTTNADNSSISIDLNTPPSYDEGEGEGEGDVRDDKMTGCVTPNRVFSCNYCRRKFYSSQALGGHQNAHKRERTIAKRAMRIGVLADRHVSLASLPLYGCYSTTSSSSSRRPSIDIQAHHGSVTMMQHQQQQISTTILPHHHGGTPFHGLRGGPAKFQGQNGYCGNSNGSFLPAVPCWPGSFRRVDDEAHSSTNTGISSSNNNINNDVIRDDDNYYDHDYVIRSNNPHHLDKPDSSSPDLTLKL